MIEICGDGRNLGQYECDDGNLYDGDGCSSECRIEDGYKCTSYAYKPDVCIYIKPPTATMTLRTGNILVITFSELILSTANSKLLSETIDVSLKRKCVVDWALINNFKANTIHEALHIKAYPECSLNKDTFIVQFKNRSKIQDLAGNSLATEFLAVKTRRYKRGITNSIAHIIGATIKYATMSTFIFMLFLSLFQGYVIDSLWHFINMLQILSYIPLLNCDLPNNFRIILTDYLSGDLFVLPFDMIPEFPYNPLDYLSVFITEPLNERFGDLNYESISFIFNFADELLTWLTLLLIYIGLRVLQCIAPTFG